MRHAAGNLLGHTYIILKLILKSLSGQCGTKFEQKLKSALPDHIPTQKKRGYVVLT